MDAMSEQQDEDNSGKTSHKSIILFYKYFPEREIELLKSKKDENYTMQNMYKFHHDLCTNLDLRGRLLLAPEGINGTLSGSEESSLRKYIKALEEKDEALYLEIDWKWSSVGDSSDTETDAVEPFPDLKISIVKEVVSSGNSVNASEISKFGGKHLSPQEFHEVLTGSGAFQTEGQKKQKEVVMIDVRNTFEYAIGHFEDHQGNKAMNPSMLTFSSFDPVFCAQNSDYLKDKKVLMYCTGGIRCEKASAMLRKRGVDDVNQLQGGIHRYLEAYPDGGLFRGKNFVFDHRVAVTPTDNKCDVVVVGRCLECNAAYDRLSANRICTVCRALVLVCDSCEERIREYHCEKHLFLKNCYFTFLNVFDGEELTRQMDELKHILTTHPNATSSRRVRQTINKQIIKVKNLLKQGYLVDKNAPRRCRMCLLTSDKCDGYCWGFWKR